MVKNFRLMISSKLQREKFSLKGTNKKTASQIILLFIIRKASVVMKVFTNSHCKAAHQILHIESYELNSFFSVLLSKLCIKYAISS